ncbi:MAG TPA: type II toxin-antitoxin system VapC family toxin [Thermoanaerobaculia bacterium]|nr:type II toxin-antitoxin system VapC family toxin [Thermoanaerobaculia bacterium]
MSFLQTGRMRMNFAARLRQPANVIVPTAAIYEVYKWIKRERSEDAALDAVATMKKAIVADLTEEIALIAADLSLSHGLAMADAMMLAFAKANRAELFSTDSDFEEITGVTVFPKKPQ